jgi:predicted SAM-dependent methyltransferase
MNETLTWINLGCGANILPAPWQNHDRDVDVTKRLPWLDGTVDFILIEHCLEHVTGPEGFHFMREAYRILKKGGTLRICVPQLRNLSQDARVSIITCHGHLMVYCPENMRLMLWTAGFTNVQVEVPRKECDGHWKIPQVGLETDTLETMRTEAIK